MIIACGFAFHSSFPGGPAAPLTASFGEEPGRKCWAQVGGWRHFATHQNSLCTANATADSQQLFSTGNEAKSKLRPLCLSALHVKSKGRPSGKNNHLDKPSTNMLINSQGSCYCSMLIVSSGKHHKKFIEVFWKQDSHCILIAGDQRV